MVAKQKRETERCLICNGPTEPHCKSKNCTWAQCKNKKCGGYGDGQRPRNGTRRWTRHGGTAAA